MATPYLLAAGSLLLLPGPLLWLTLGQSWPFIMSFPAMFLLLLGSLTLGAAVAEVPSVGPLDRRRKGVMWAAYGTAWIGFAVGVVNLNLAGAQSGLFSTLPPELEQIAIAFPYIPSVWAPAVVAYAVIFGLIGQFLPGRRALRMNSWAVSALIAIAGAALALQLLGPLPAWAYLFAGLTGFGYLLVGIAWRLPVPVPSRPPTDLPTTGIPP